MRNRLPIAVQVPTMLAALFLSTGVDAATFCVGTADELTAALATASTNNSGDTIRVKTGTYQRNTGVYAFEFVSDGSNLDISGGWSGAGAACTTQSTVPGATVIDGAGERGLFRIIATDVHYDVEIERFTFRDGESDVGGAIRTQTTLASDGIVIIEANVFDGNHATSSAGAVSALALLGALHFRNNLLVDNSADGGNAYVANLSAVNDTLTTTLIVEFNTIVGSGCLAPNMAGCLAAVQVCCNKVGVWNNVWFDNDVADLRIATSSEAVVVNNIYGQLVGTAPVASQNNVVTSANPGFVNYLDRNFVPRLTSLMRDAATDDFPLPANDLPGVPRVLGPMPDIGAFESPFIFSGGFETLP